MKSKLDEKDLAILALLQKNCKLSVRVIAEKIDSPITTAFAKMKRMEKLGIIKEYKAILDPEQLDVGVKIFILCSVFYGWKGDDAPISQREVARKICEFPEVQEVHIITGNWDLLVKLATGNVNSGAKFVVDKLRAIKGIEKTLTCMVFETCKETTEIPIKAHQT